MITSELQIYNLAVDAVGGTGTIATVDEESREAELCRRWFAPTRDQVLAGAHWASAKRYKRLALLTERAGDTWVSTDPSPGYGYAFSCPADLLAPRYLSDFSRFDFHRLDDTNTVISVATEDPILTYTSRITPVQMEHNLAMAIMAALAAFICSPLTGQTNKGRMLLQEANEAIMRARQETANYAQQPQAHIPDFIAARGYGAVSAQSLNYVYEFGPLFAAGNIGG